MANPAPKNIFLTGFMGSGKSTVGPLLARALGWVFVDLDKRIEIQRSRTIAEIFAEEGEPVFRKLECQVLRDLCTQALQVVSLGGGALLQPGNAECVSTSGVLFYLKASPEVLMERLKRGVSRRPLVSEGLSVERIKELLVQREEAYLKAEYQIDTDSKTPFQIASEIERILK